MKKFSILICCVVLAFAACRKENSISTDPTHKLAFSTDTILFDTVFTTLGSSTHHLKIYNPYPDDLNISEIHVKQLRL